MWIADRIVRRGRAHSSPSLKSPVCGGELFILRGLVSFEQKANHVS